MFHLVAQPHLYPGTELMGLQSPGGFVDTGVEMTVGGRVYLSEIVVAEAARLFGFVSKADAAQQADQLQAARERIIELEGELAELGPVKSAIETAAERWHDQVPA